MEALCRLFGKSRQAYYERSGYVATKSMEEEVVVSLVRAVRKDFPRMGSRKLLIYLKPKFESMDIRIGRDYFIDLLYRNHLLVRRAKNKRKTTYSNHWMHKYPNLIKGYTPECPNHLWVSDITYVDTCYGGNAYLSLVTDVYSHKIVGWNLAKTLESRNALAALKMALKDNGGKHAELIHHSDRGSQYCSKVYVGLLTRHAIRISMTESGDPKENAVAERINGIIKNEWLEVDYPDSWQKLIACASKAIDLYNNQRPHQSIGYMVPALIHQTGQQTERKWKSYYKAKAKERGNDAATEAMPPQPHHSRALLLQKM